MPECPSRAAERYIQSQELPEECPVCGHDNGDRNGDWLCQGHEPFCSVKCEEEYRDTQQQADRAYADSFKEDRVHG